MFFARIFALVAAWLFFSSPLLSAQVPEWIWHNNNGKSPADNEVRFFRKTFEVSGRARKAVLTISADNAATVYLNGRKVASSTDWHRPVTVDVTRLLRNGSNSLAARGQNESGAAAFIARLEITLRNNQKQLVVSDDSWRSSNREEANWYQPDYGDSLWTAAVSQGKLGVQPWGDILVQPVATPADKLTVLPGFKIELLHSAESGEGSWASMAVDNKGRLIISPQEGVENMLRVTLSSDGDISEIEKIDLPVGSAMGLLYAFDSLYVNGRGPKGLGLYRIRDTNGDDHFDHVELLRQLDGAGGEHGSHAVVLGPDNMLYVINGNFVKIPNDISPQSPHRHYAEDQLLPRQEDGNGFGVGIKPPGGFILRMDPDAKHCELFAAGMRNTYDFDFNPDGEIFGFDSDMEWDWGTPWYRPIRICHLVSGGDYGFREGTGKFPTYYPDSLPPALNVGIGSPTGVKFGTHSNFPPKYRRAMFAMDWSYGRILAVHLHPEGASYTGSFETLVVGKPLNVTDLEFGKDGAMYFITGGRGTQSGLYRVSWDADVPPGNQASLPDSGDARKLRHQLEAFHGRKDPAAVQFAWPHLNSDDRWIRYAARIAIESHPVQEWQERALYESRPNASLTALLALARLGDSNLQDRLLESLDRLPWHDFTEEQKLEGLRVLELAFIRMGRPSPETARDVVERLNPSYPASSPRLNRELCQILIYLQAPDVVKKSLQLLASAPTQEEQLVYIFHLRTLKTGWTMDDRRFYFSWFNRDRAADQHPAEVEQWFADAGRSYSDGASFAKFMVNIKKDAVDTLTDAERQELSPYISGQSVVAAPVVQRAFVKEWQFEDLLPDLAQVNQGRSFDKGKAAFLGAQCIACHRFGNEGGSVGPDITGAASRFNLHDLLETIVKPSKIISDQYQNIVVTTRDGDLVVGRLVEENDQKLVLVTNPLTGEKAEVAKADVESRAPSKVSPMPEGLLNVLTKEEILDLLAFIESGGKQDAAVFSQAKK